MSGKCSGFDLNSALDLCIPERRALCSVSAVCNRQFTRCTGLASTHAKMSGDSLTKEEQAREHDQVKLDHQANHLR